MNSLELTLEDAELVRGMLSNYLGTLTREIDHTDRRAFKRMLLERRDKVASLLERCSMMPSDDRPKEREATETH